MSVREKFDCDLTLLSQKLVHLGELAEVSLEKAFEAFEKQDSELALQVLEDDEKVNLLEEEINDFAMLLIAKQQPVAIDLRRIIVGIKIAAEIERIADYAVNISKATIRMGKQEHRLAAQELKQMHVTMLQMLKLAIKAYGEEDIQAAKKIAAMDDEVDYLYGLSMKIMMGSGDGTFQHKSQLSFVARHIERAADHVTNVAENVYYLVRGRHLDLNR